MHAGVYVCVSEGMVSRKGKGIDRFIRPDQILMGEWVSAKHRGVKGHSTQEKPYEFREARVSMGAFGNCAAQYDWMVGKKEVVRHKTAEVGTGRT